MFKLIKGKPILNKANVYVLSVTVEQTDSNEVNTQEFSSLEKLQKSLDALIYFMAEPTISKNKNLLEEKNIQKGFEKMQSTDAYEMIEEKNEFHKLEKLLPQQLNSDDESLAPIVSISCNYYDENGVGYFMDFFKDK